MNTNQLPPLYAEPPAPASPRPAVGVHTRRPPPLGRPATRAGRGPGRPPLPIGLLLAAWLLGLPAAAAAQQFVVSPRAEVLSGDDLQIRLTGLPPQGTVTVQAHRVLRDFSGGLRRYTAQARFVAGPDGGLDLATAQPLPGSSYTQPDLRGLFWSMVPAPAPAATAATAATTATATATATAQTDAPTRTPTESPTETPALAEHEVLLQAHGPAAEPAAPGSTGPLLARQSLRLLRALPAVQTRPADPFPGARFASLPGAAPRPGLMLLGGSEGGSLVTRDAAFWASLGYAVLAVPYYSPPGWSPSGPTPPELPALPAAFADIPVERLEQARAWLAAQPGVDATRIGVMGTSKGAELALLAAVRMPWIRSVVAIVPTDVVWEGWGPGVAPGQRSSFAWQGQPLPFVPYKGFEEEFAGFATGQPVRFRRPQDAGRAAHPGRVPAARIPVEDIAAPVLVAGAHDDQVWDSGGMAQAIAAARAQAGRDTVALVFADAGHYLGGTGWAPTTQYNAGPMKAGGTPAATARAQAEVHAQVRAFLRRTLGPVPQ